MFSIYSLPQKIVTRVKLNLLLFLDSKQWFFSVYIDIFIMSSQTITITVFRWAGEWGSFKVNIHCGECSLTKDVISDTINNELNGVDVVLDMRDWLSEWWKPLKKGGWHAPIVMVDNKIISQGRALNRGLLTEAVIDAHARKTKVTENTVFGKENCPHCQHAKAYLQEANIPFVYHDVVKEPKALYEMLARVKPIVGPKTPITVPQIWLEGDYIGGAAELNQRLHAEVPSNPDRGQYSLSPST